MKKILFFFLGFILLLIVGQMISSSSSPIDNDINIINQIQSVRYSSMSLGLYYSVVTIISGVISLFVLNFKGSEKNKVLFFSELNWLIYHFFIILLFLSQSFILFFLTPYLGKYSDLYPFSAAIANILYTFSVTVILSWPFLAIILLRQVKNSQKIPLFIKIKHALILLFLLPYFLPCTLFTLAN